MSRRELLFGKFFGTLAEALPAETRPDPVRKAPKTESPRLEDVHWVDPRARRPSARRPEGHADGPRIAKVLIFECLAHLGTFCATCSERCPEPGAIRVERGKPIVVEAACTGCGLCADVCPAPVGAIVVAPRAV